MNFLSHYYFERFSLDSHQVLGGLLPDLLKNVDKSYSFQIQKYESSLESRLEELAITRGWKRHVEVDKIFHTTDFFYEHTHRLRKIIEPILHDLPVRGSFLAHIGLELLLDHMLIENGLLSVNRLYEHLAHVNKRMVADYLKVFERVEEDKFFNFYERFVSSRYILEYADITNLPYALFNICKRIWDFEVTATHYEALAVQLIDYKNEYLNNYLDIYSEIQHRLDS